MSELETSVSRGFDSLYINRLIISMQDGDFTKAKEAIAYLSQAQIELQTPNITNAAYLLLLVYTTHQQFSIFPKKFSKEEFEAFSKVMDAVKSTKFKLGLLNSYKENMDAAETYLNLVKLMHPLSIPTYESSDVPRLPENPKRKNYVAELKAPKDITSYLFSHNVNGEHKVDEMEKNLLILMRILNNPQVELANPEEIERTFEVVDALMAPMLISSVDGLKSMYVEHMRNPDNAVAVALSKASGLAIEELANPVVMAKAMREKLLTPKLDDIINRFMRSDKSLAELYATTVRFLDERISTAEAADTMIDTKWNEGTDVPFT